MRYSIFFLVLFLLTSCNVTKHLQEDELLITKTEIQYEKPSQTRNEQEFKEQLSTAIQPTPNTGLFKFRLAVHQWANKKEKKFRKKISNILGEAPALYNAEEQKRNRLRMKKMLKDNGFFDSEIEVDTIVSGKKVAIVYKVLTEGQYKINKVWLPSDSSAIGRLVIKNKNSSIIKSGDYYSELNLAAERVRIANLASNNGYIDFNENYIYYLVDTLPGTFKADIYMRVELPEGKTDHEQYRLGLTRVYPNYDISNNEVSAHKDTVKEARHLYIYEDYHLVDHKILDRMILQDQGEVLSKKYQDASVNHLLNLGMFKFVNLKYERTADSTEQVINRSFYLTPSNDQNFSADLELNNRTGNFYGIGASASYTHRNLFKKALIFNTSLSGGLETQIGNNLGFINTLDMSVSASLSTPRFILPFKFNEYSKLSLPKTTLSIGNDYQQRFFQFTLNATNLKLGYQWKQNARKQHSLYPVAINIVNVLNKSAALDSLIEQTRRLKNSFQNVFIAGLDYTYVYSNQSPNPKKDFWYFKTNLRTSGNLFQMVSSTFGLSKGTDEQYEIGGLPFAQFLSLEADLRYYEILNNSTLVFRISPAIGLAYGNSEVLPYVEQFFVGGANSIRAFPIRSLGPGNFKREDDAGDGIASQFIDQTGDIKLEMNAEYRFPIFGFFKGAVFVDVGNVWLLNDDTVGEGEFAFNTFLEEIAVGSGLGFRLDTEIIVIRFDIGIPLRGPVYGKGFEWTFNQFDFGSKKWRGDNLVGNIAIGYPF